MISKIFLRTLISAFFIFYVCIVCAQSLKQAVHETLTQNPEVLQKQANADAARESVTRARSEFFPRLDVRFAAGREHTDNDYAGYNETQLTLHRTEANLVLTQSLFSGFSSYNLLKQRKYEFESSKLAAASSEESLALQAAIAYLDVLRVDELYKLTLKNVEMHKLILSKVTMKHEGGAGRKAEVDLAKGRLAQSLSNLHANEGAKQDTISAFLKVIGHKPGILSLSALPKAPRSLTRAENIALLTNPALNASKETLNAADKAVSVTKSRFLPQIDLQVVRGNNSNIDGVRGRQKDLKAMVVANYNLFNGGGDQAVVKIAAHNRMSALYNRDRIRRIVIDNVSQAWNDLNVAKSRLPELRSHVISSKETLEGYKQQFSLGRRSLLDLLDMENEVYRAESALVNGKYSIRFATYRLLANMGILVKSIG